MYRPCLHCEGKQYDENYCPEICTYGEDKKRLKELEEEVKSRELSVATPENVAYAISFFEKHLKEDILRYGERQAIHIALELLREKQKEG